MRVNGDKVRLGIECDKSVSIHREEVFNEIKRNAELMDSFDALGDDEDGCGPDGNYVDQ